MNKKTNKKKILFWTAGSIAAVLVLLLLVFFVMVTLGKYRMKHSGSQDGLSLGETDTEEDWEEGWIRYKGEPYAYNKDILTFLIMGIDQEGKVSKAKDEISGGQADALFLVVMNPHDKSLDIVGINRNMMTQVDVYDKDGTYMGQHLKQIALQHGYGDGMKISCERTVEAVSRFLYDLPINGYASINMGAIRELNAAVGGVRVTILEDLDYKSYGFQEKVNVGDEIKLSDDQAYMYVRERDCDEFDSASGRMEHQKQYLAAFTSLAKQKLQTDISFAYDLYKAVEDYMVSSIDFAGFSYLVTEILGYSFDSGSFKNIESETVMGEEFEEVYADEEALYDLVMELFYEPVKK